MTDTKRNRTRSRSRSRTPARDNRRGVAMLMGLFALTLAATASTAFVKARDKSVEVGQSAADGAKARAVASQGVSLAKEILRKIFTEDDNQWWHELSDGVLLDDYELGDAVLDISIEDLVTGAAPDSDTTDFLAGVTVTVGGSSYSVDAELSLSSLADGQFAIFAQDYFAMEGTNFIGRWENAPYSSYHDPVNIGTMARSQWLGYDGCYFADGAYFEGDPVAVAGDHASLASGLSSEPDAFGRAALSGGASTTISAAAQEYSFTNGANPAAAGSWTAVGSANEKCRTFLHHPSDSDADFAWGDSVGEVDQVLMAAGQSVEMIDPVGEPNFSNGQSEIGSRTYSGQTKTLTSFRLRCQEAGGVPVSGGDLTITNNSVITLKSGVYRIEDRFLLENSRLIINGQVKFIVKGRLTAQGDGPRFHVKNSTIELKNNSRISWWVARSMKFEDSWLGAEWSCSNGVQGDPHKQSWMGTWAATACSSFPPSEPLYLEPTRVDFYADEEGANESFTWEFNDSSVIGSVLLHTNPVVLSGDSEFYGRIAAREVRMTDTASFFYDHALDDESGLTEGVKPPRGGDHDIPTRVHVDF